MCISSIQSISHTQLFATPRTAAHQASLSITNSQNLLKLMSIKLVILSNHLILCRPLLLPPSTFPSIRVFSSEAVLRNGSLLQHSCLENPIDGGAWWAAVHGVVKSQTRLSDFTFTFHFHASEKEMASHASILAWRIPGMAISRERSLAQSLHC